MDLLPKPKRSLLQVTSSKGMSLLYTTTNCKNLRFVTCVDITASCKKNLANCRIADESSAMKWRISSDHIDYTSNTLSDYINHISDHMSFSKLPFVSLVNRRSVRKEVGHNEVAVANFCSCHYILLTSHLFCCLLL